jgi:hypothetical protein
MSSAMNLSTSQKEAISTLPIGSAVVRLADQHPEPFMVRVPKTSIVEGQVSDQDIATGRDSGVSLPIRAAETASQAIPPLPGPDRKQQIIEMIEASMISTHPPSSSTHMEQNKDPASPPHQKESSKAEPLSREAIRFLADVCQRPLSTTVQRYNRLRLSRRKGNAIRTSLVQARVISQVAISTRSGQVMLCQITDAGRTVCVAHDIDPPPTSPESLEHRYWKHRAADHFKNRGYGVRIEHRVPGDGFIDVLAVNGSETLAVEIETGRSDIRKNVTKLQEAGYERIVLLATSPEANIVCDKVVSDMEATGVEVMTWIDLG